MSNPHKGEVEFTVDKKVYTLSFSINAMCELEDAINTSVVDMATLAAEGNRLSFKKARTLFWAGLKDHHEAITETDAGRLMTAIGFPQSMELVGKAFSLAFPEVDVSRPLDAKLPKVDLSTGKAH